MDTKNFYSPSTFRRDIMQGEISRAHLYSMIKKGEIPTVRIGQRLLIPGTYVRQLLDEEQVKQ